MNQSPKLSIITPSYNQDRYLEQTIQSVLSQEYPCLEYIIIDGGSTDSSKAIIQKYGSMIDYWVSEPDRGQGEAINKGLARASGEFVAWINSDDFYLPQALHQATYALIESPEVGMVYGDGILIDQNGCLLDWHRYDDYSVVDLLQFKVILQPTVVMRRSAIERVGFLSENYHLVLDHELWIRIASEFPIMHVKNYWAAERTYPEAKTRALAADFVDEAQLMIESLNQNPSTSTILTEKSDLIRSSLNAFAGRRLIDAGEYKSAITHFVRAASIHPIPPVRYWYKVLQAAIGLIGLEWLFLSYRRWRRRIQHRGVVVTINGVVHTPPRNLDEG